VLAVVRNGPSDEVAGQGERAPCDAGSWNGSAKIRSSELTGGRASKGALPAYFGKQGDFTKMQGNA
jgi:hypothetical protein